MITAEMVAEARSYIREEWEETAEQVIDACSRQKGFGGTVKDFLDHCTACGGNWGGMFLTGIRELFPDVYDAIPENMGVHAFTCIANVLVLCGVDTSA